MPSISEVLHLSQGDIQPPEQNARRHDVEQIAQIVRSISEFGFVNPVAVDEHDRILAGHGRWLAAKQLGLEEVPCLRIEGLTDDQKAAFALADNRIGLNSEWHEKRLAEQVKHLIDTEGEALLIGLGFDQDQLIQLDMIAGEELAGLEKEEADEDLGALELGGEPRSFDGLDSEDADPDETDTEDESLELKASFVVYLRREDYAEVIDLVSAIKQEQGFKDSADVLLWALRTVTND